MKDLLDKLKQIFHKKITTTNSSTDDALSDVDPVKEVLKEVRRIQDTTGKIAADHVKVVAMLCFKTEVYGPFYKLKNHNKYGQYFEIETVIFDWSEDNTSLDDIIFKFVDSSFNSSVRLVVSIRDLNEWMSPVKPPVFKRDGKMV